MRSYQEDYAGSLRRPGPALTGALVAIVGAWLLFSIGTNWATGSVQGLAEDLFDLLVGGTDHVLHGELWRLVTSSLLHHPASLSHILFAALGLYFLGGSLEREWGGRAFIGFLVMAGLTANGVQVLVDLLAPDWLTAKLIPPVWYDSYAIVDAIAIAWALNFRGQQLRLFFLIPVSSQALVYVVIGGSLLYVIIRAEPPSGLIAPFGGMLAGWLFGTNPTPLRRWWLKRRLRRHEDELARLRRERHRKVAARSHLRVIDGGLSNPDEGSGTPDGSPRGPNGKMLN